MKVTKEQVEKAKAEWLTVYYDANAAAEEASRVAYAAAEAAAEATTKPAWDKYNKLKREYENENSN